MGRGLMQLVAYGAQDIYLTGNPQITFFKVVYRRHTNFSMESIEQTISGNNTLTTSSTTGTVTISRNGDLVHKVYVTSSSDKITNGMALVNEVELEIGGQRIDKHYQEWNEIWNELSTPSSKAEALLAMTGSIGSSGTSGVGMVQVPLNFWFCRNPGLALPLIALQYHEVKLKFTWGLSSATGGTPVCKVMVDYIYLDTDERRRFAQQSHEYLIEQLQKQSDTGSVGNLKLNFNHPVKELIWTSDQAYTDAKLVLNGHDRFAAQEEEYFQLRQPMDHHTAVPGQNLSSISTYEHTLTATTQEVTAADVDADTKVKFAAGTHPVSTVLFRNGTDGDLVEVGDVLQVVNSSAAAKGGTFLVTKKTSSTATVDTDAATGRQFNLNLLSNTGATDAQAFVAPADTETLVITLFKQNKVRGLTARTSKMTDKVNVYSFALKPEEHQPSGTCNFSRIDTAKLNFTADPHSGTMNTYAVNYNVLRIMSGMGGLAYSN